MIQLVSAYILKQGGKISDPDPSHHKGKLAKKGAITKLYQQYGAQAFAHMGIVWPVSGGYVGMARNENRWGRQTYENPYMESRLMYWGKPQSPFVNADGDECLYQTSDYKYWGMIGTSVMYFDMCRAHSVPCRSILFRHGASSANVIVNFDYKGDGWGANYEEHTERTWEASGVEQCGGIAIAYGELIDGDTRVQAKDIVYGISVFIKMPVFNSVEDYQRYEQAVEAYLSNPSDANLQAIQDAMDYSENPD